MSEKTKFQRAKKHFHENKKLYLACGTTAITTTIAVLIVTSNKEGFKISQSIGSMNWKPVQVQKTYVLPQVSNLAKPVLDTTTNTPYLSQRRAAKALGASESQVSQHLNRQLPDVKNHILEYIPVA